MNYGRLHVTPHLADFLDSHPQLRLDAQFDDRYVDVMAEGFDLAIRIGQLEDSRLVARRTARDRRLVVASPDYLDRHGVPGHPRDLTQHECLHYTNFRGPVTWTFHQGRIRIDVPVQGRFKANYGLPLTVAAERGLGLVQTAVSIVGESLASGALVEDCRNGICPKLASMPSIRSDGTCQRRFGHFSISSALGCLPRTGHSPSRPASGETARRGTDQLPQVCGSVTCQAPLSASVPGSVPRLHHWAR